MSLGAKPDKVRTSAARSMGSVGMGADVAALGEGRAGVGGFEAAVREAVEFALGLAGPPGRRGLRFGEAMVVLPAVT
jgi:hypothetical protein